VRRRDGQPGAELRHDALVLDVAGKRVSVAGEPVALTAREFAILHALMRHPGHVVSRAQLEDTLYGWGDEVDSNAIEVHVYHLRRKLGSDVIKTIRRQGYRMGG